MKMTLIQKFYAINTALNLFLRGQGVRCQVIKYGVDPATTKVTSNDQTSSRYPYMQTWIPDPPRPNAWTSRESGIYTRFKFQLNFYTAPEFEFENDALLYTPFNLARIAFSDVAMRVLMMTDPEGNTFSIADVLKVHEPISFKMTSGSPVIQSVLLVEMATVCAYPEQAILPDPGYATDLYDAIQWIFN